MRPCSDGSGVGELGLELDDEVAAGASAMRREARAGHAQAARMGKAGFELDVAHTLRVGHAQGTADQQT